MMLWRNVPADERVSLRREIGLAPAPIVQRLSGSYEAASVRDAAAAFWADVDRAAADPDPPKVMAYEWTTEWPEPSCLIAVPVDHSTRHYRYKPCNGKAGRDGFCSRHRPDILRAPPVPNIVGEGW